MNIDSYISQVDKAIRMALAKEWAASGHKLTNELIDNSYIEVKKEDNKITVSGFLAPYGTYMDRGVKASSIRWSGQGGGGRSLYIEGLMKYVSMRMGFAKGSQQNKSIAFAIANKQKQKGSPLRTNGKGTGWLKRGLKNIQPEFERITYIYFAEVISGELTKLNLYSNGNNNR